MESFQIHLNSKYSTSYNGNTTSSCNFSLPSAIEIPNGYTMYLSVQSASIPYSFYNINSTNNTITLQEIIVDAIGNQTGVITNTLYMIYGNYNAHQLAAHMMSLFIGGRMNVTYNGITNKFVFVNTTYNFKFLQQYSSCIELIGLSTNNLYNQSVLLSYTSINVINLSSVKCICVATNLISNSLTNISGNEQNILCSIPVDSQPYSMISFRNNNNFKVNMNTNYFNSISIKLIDENGKLIDLNSQYFALTLQIDIISFVD